MLSTLGTEVERLFEDLSKGVNDAADAFIQFSEELADQVNDALAPSLDNLNQEMEGWVDPFLQIIAQIEASFSDAVSPLSQTVDPLINQHPACVGCQHYHGQEYNGVMLVCGMHPYGWEGEECPDWESTWQDPH
ncbi:MAG TPA: hypothetical protein IGS37_07200 [Synechococcales cyanobacterium M55_K2018_004]|nr:hypothetical protein [Synechococcales cyanobacterium M55_K2018_004]